MSINSLLTGVQSDIVGGITQLKDRNVAIHGGRVTAETIKRHALANRAAVLLTCLKVTDIRTEAGERWGDVQLAAFVSALAKPGEDAFTRAVDFTETVVGIIHDRHPAVCAERADKIQVDNLFSVELEKAGVSLWGVRWQHRTKLSAITDTADAFDWITSEITSEPEPGPAVSSVITTEEG